MSTEHVLHLAGRISDRAAAVVAVELKARGLGGLAPSHAELLARLGLADGPSMMELAERLGRDKSTVTVLVKKLAAQGLVEARKDDRDLRVTRVWLTDAARALRPALDAIQHQLLSRAWRGFSWSERAELVRLLERLLGNL